MPLAVGYAWFWNGVVRVDSLQYPLWDVWRLEGCVLYWTSL